MRTLTQLIVFSILIFVILMLSGCPESKQAPLQQDSNQENGTSLESQPDTGDPASDTIEEAIANTALDLLAKLGCNTSSFEIISVELLTGEYSLLWGVTIGNELKDVAMFHINEENLQVEFVSIFGTDLLSPTLRDTDNSNSQVAELLGFYAEGYRLAEWLIIDEVVSEYRKFVTWDEREIVVGQIHIAFPPSPDAPMIINRIENDLLEPVVINMDLEGAVSNAESYLSDMGFTDLDTWHAELIQLRSEPYGPADFSVFWELVFTDQTVHVNADDGSIMEAQ